jgi:hypothetical protein
MTMIDDTQDDRMVIHDFPWGGITYDRFNDRKVGCALGWRMSCSKLTPTLRPHGRHVSHSLRYQFRFAWHTRLVG